MVQTTNGYANVEGGKLYYEMAGEGRTLVLGHAGLCDRRQWDDQWDAFAREYRVVRYDMRGYGQSDPITGPISRRADLYGLLRALGVESAALLGCSMSGTTAIDFTLEHPAMVWALIPFSATPGGFDFEGEMPPMVQEMMAASQRGDVERTLDLQNQIWLSGPKRPLDQIDPALARRVTEMNRRPVTDSVFFRADAQPLDPLDPPAAERLTEITAPTLVMAGALDDAEIIRAAEIMDGRIPDTRKHIIQNGAHLANLEQPAEFNRAVLDFLHTVN